jgi:hypothetical protein
MPNRYLVITTQSLCILRYIILILTASITYLLGRQIFFSTTKPIIIRMIMIEHIKWEIIMRMFNYIIELQRKDDL